MLINFWQIVRLCREMRQGWERYEPKAASRFFRPAEATGGSPTHGRARARVPRARAKTASRQGEYKRTARWPAREERPA